MAQPVQTVEPATLPTPPQNPLPYWQQVKAVRQYYRGLEVLRDAGGPVTRCWLGPSWVSPPIVAVTSP